MIKVSRQNDTEFHINDELIETMETSSGSTVISMSNGKKYVAKETIDEIMERIIAFRRRYSQN